mmetsp:Transcript_8819/g.26249  ORF Transcript_8819/g.26249 Transcript_8819/m.26249 type:complete len:169 (+) Transcript_8819:97-603(+)
MTKLRRWPSRPLPPRCHSLKPSKIAAPTCTSTAASGSSATKSEGSRYNARAMFNLVCCPPDNVVPRSPISVCKPCCMSSKSRSNWAAAIARASRFCSTGRPMTMFDNTLPLNTSARCGTNATAARVLITEPVATSAPPNKPSNTVLFPEPTWPTTADISPQRNVAETP